MSLNIEKRKYRLTGLTRLLAAQAANPDVRSEYIASKAPDAKKGDDETEHLPPESMESKGLTVFLRHVGILSLSDYVIKGFLKEALGAIKSQVGIANVATKIDNYVMIEPAYLHIRRNMAGLKAPDDILERPLRAMTMQGPRVSLTASEMVEAGWDLEFEISLLENPGTTKSKPLSFDVIEQALEYGAFKGLGQWRNAQNGRFTFERIA